MLSPIILYSFEGETFLSFPTILIISIPFPLDPVLDDAIPLVLLVLDDAFEGPLVTQTVRLYRSWLSSGSGGQFGFIILMLGGEEEGVDLEVAGGYKGVFEGVIVSIRVHARDRVGTKEDRFQFRVLRIRAHSKMVDFD